MSDLTDVIERASCSNCRRPLAYLAGIGWIHDELPRYAGQPITCEMPDPVERRCTTCHQPQVVDNTGRVTGHRADGAQCSGSWTQGVALIGSDGGSDE